jgi:hypothetical protein
VNIAQAERSIESSSMSAHFPRKELDLLGRGEKTFRLSVFERGEQYHMDLGSPDWARI